MSRGKTRAWQVVCTHEAVDAFCTAELSSLCKCKKQKSYQSSIGRVEVFCCKMQACPAMRCILYHVDSQKLTVYSFLDHNHGTDIRSDLEKAKELVHDLLQKGITKPSVIRTHLPTDVLLSDIQLSNLIQRVMKTSNILPFRMTSADLKQFCLEHCSMPGDLDKAYVFSFDLADEELCKDLPVFRVLFSTRRLLQTGLQGRYWHVDATYKIVWQGYPVLVLGTCDQAKQFHPITFMLAQGETEEDYTYLLRKTRFVLQNISDCSVQPDAVIADGAAVITNAVTNVFGDTVGRGMCWAHCIRKVDERLRSVSSPHKEALREDICFLQLSSSTEVFNKTTQMFFGKWDVCMNSDVQVFLTYFTQQWIDLRPNWYEGFAPNGPSTNNGLEATNRYFKEKTTFREKLPLNEFLLSIQRTLEDWSKERQNNGRKRFVSAPDIGTKEYTEAWQWMNKSLPVEEVGDCWYCGETKDVEDYLEM